MFLDAYSVCLCVRRLSWNLFLFVFLRVLCILAFCPSLWGEEVSCILGYLYFYFFICSCMCVSMFVIVTVFFWLCKRREISL